MQVGESLLDKRGNVVDPERVMQISGVWLGIGLSVINANEADFDLTYANAGGESLCSIIFETQVSQDDKRVLFIESMYSSGMGTKAFSRLLGLCDRLGIDRIELTAKDAGGYFWARLGFLPEQSGWRSVSNAIYAKFLRISSDPDSDISCKDANDFRAIASSKQGKDLLRNTNWQGYLDLKDGHQMQFCNDYISSKLGRGI